MKPCRRSLHKRLPPLSPLKRPMPFPIKRPVAGASAGCWGFVPPVCFRLLLRVSPALVLSDDSELTVKFPLSLSSEESARKQKSPGRPPLWQETQILNQSHDPDTSYPQDDGTQMQPSHPARPSLRSVRQIRSSPSSVACTGRISHQSSL